jgi:hypothetical protein
MSQLVLLLLLRIQWLPDKSRRRGRNRRRSGALVALCYRELFSFLLSQHHQLLLCSPPAHSLSPLGLFPLQHSRQLLLLPLAQEAPLPQPLAEGARPRRVGTLPISQLLELLLFSTHQAAPIRAGQRR